MTPALIAQLLVQFGLPLTQQLVTLYHSGNAPVTPEQWAALVLIGQYRSTDSLAAQGLKIDGDKVVKITP